MRLALIVAMDSERGIGKNNDLMWHLPADMKFFREQTTGQVVVMGRKNYDSLPEKFRPLPNRENVVLTRNRNFKADGCLVFHDLDECLDHFRSETERTVFVIGGGEIYRQTMHSDQLTEMYVTHVDKVYDADTHFPSIHEEDWEISEIFSQEKDEKHDAGFVIRHYYRVEESFKRKVLRGKF